MHNEAPIARALRLAFSGSIAGLLLSSLPALAQTTSDQTAPQRVEKIEITGSSIKRIDAETALPVQIITKQDIDRSGATSVEELLRMVTATSSTGSIQAASAAGATTGSASTVSLRGLGGARTLVLINGRRTTVFGGVPGGGTDTAVDVNSIPIAAIERIEVLKDGASAVYGSDAIAGVINFILRKDYVGGEVTVGYGESTRSPGHDADKKANVLLGFGDLQKDRFNVTIGAGYDKQDPLFGGERAFANSSYNASTGANTTSGNTFPANIAIAPDYSSYSNPLYPACDPSNHLIAIGAHCRYDPASYVNLIPDSERRNAMGSVHFAITPDLELYGEGAYSENRTKVSIQPVPLSDQFSIPSNNPYNAYLQNLINTQYPALAAQLDPLVGTAAILIPPSSPYYPTAFAAANGMAGQPLVVRYRDTASGFRRLEDDTDNYRALIGLKGTLAGWDFDTGLLHVESNVKEKTLGGFPQYSLLLPVLDSGGIDVFGPGGTPSAIAAAAAANYNAQVFNSITKQDSIDAKASREIFNLPAGAVSLALGAEFRREDFDFTSSSTIQTGDVSGYGGNFLPLSKSRNVKSAFAEVDLPVLRTVDVDLAGRYDNYEGVGNTVNPKASVRWQPNQSFLLRGSIGTGFRAPSLTDLYAPQVQTVTTAGVSDPLRCPTTGSSNDCNTQFSALTGGNPGLKPEKSTSTTIGFVLEPSRNLSVGVDAFDILLKDSIVLGGLGANFFLADAQNATTYASNINRGPVDPLFPGIPGPITSISTLNTNLFKSHLRGADLDVKWRAYNEAGRKLTLTLNGTYYTKYDVQNPDGSYTGVINNGLGGIFLGGVVARWRHVLAATYSSGPWEGVIAQNYQTAYSDVPANGPREVGAYETFDLQASYTGFKNFKISLGVKNVLDRDPPYSNAELNGQFQSGYDVSYGDPRGRFVYSTLTWKFL